MRLANCKFLYISSIFLLLLACTKDENPPIFGNPLENLPSFTNKLNLQSDSGNALDYVTVTWNNLGSAMLEDYSTIPPIQITAIGNSHVFSGMQPGELREIHIHIIADSTYEDSIQIFTRPIYPVTNFEFYVDAIKIGENVWNIWEEFIDHGDGIWNEGEPFEDGNGNDIWDGEEIFTDLGNDIYDVGELFVDIDTTKYHRNLIWSPTLELQGNYYIYRSTLPYDLTCSTCQIANLTLLSEGTYIDSSSIVIDEPDLATFYYMIQVSIGNFTRNSFIYNYTDFDPLYPIEINVSTDKNEFIEITLNFSGNPDYFYQYEILRTLGNPDLGNDTLLVAIIPNSEINHFWDRGDEFSDGTTYYYSVTVVDIFERRTQSDYIEGYSKP